MATKKKLNDRARDILKGLPFETEGEQVVADVITDIVLEAEAILTNQFWRLTNETMTEEQKRLMRAAIIAQWVRV